MDEVVELIGGFRLRQTDECFRFGMDSALLSAFPKLRPGMRVCDLGAGSGCLALMLLSREPSLTMDAIEISSHSCSLIQENAALNQVSIDVFQRDYRQLDGFQNLGKYDLVISNPPYFAQNTGKKAKGEMAAARGEEAGSIADFCLAASRLLRYGGELCLVYRPERLADLFCAMRSHRIEPKRLRLVSNTHGGAPILVLVQGKKGGRPALKIEKPLVIRDDSGAFSQEMREIYGR